MKRKIVLFFLLAIVLISSVHAADTVSVRIDELELSLELPADFIVFTRDMPEDDPVLTEYGIDKDQLIQILESGNIYLDALGSDTAVEFLVSMTHNEVTDMHWFDDDTLDDMMERLYDQYASKGVEATEVVRYDHPQVIFFRTTGSTELNGVPTQIQQYYTIRNHQAINLTLQYQGDQIPEEYLAVAQSIIDSAVFDADPEDGAEEPVDAPEDAVEAEAGAETGAEEVVLYEAFDYEDGAHDVRFTVPEGWVEIPFDSDSLSDAEKQAVNATFSSAENHSAAIVYEWFDVLEMVPELNEISFLDRAEIDQSSFDLETISESVAENAELRDSRVETIGGREFFVFEILDADGTAETVAVRIENGCLYKFRFLELEGVSGEAQYPDFLSLLESAEFPEAAPADALVSPAADTGDDVPDSPDPAPKKKRFPTVWVVVGIAAVSAILGAVLRGKKKRAAASGAPVPTAPAAPDTAAAAAGAAQAAGPAAPTAAAKRVCAACGADLGPDEKFCPFCGTKAD